MEYKNKKEFWIGNFWEIKHSLELVQSIQRIKKEDERNWEFWRRIQHYASTNFILRIMYFFDRDSRSVDFKSILSNKQKVKFENFEIQNFDTINDYREIRNKQFAHFDKKHDINKTIKFKESWLFLENLENIFKDIYSCDGFSDEVEVNTLFLDIYAQNK